MDLRAAPVKNTRLCRYMKNKSKKQEISTNISPDVNASEVDEVLGI